MVGPTLSLKRHNGQNILWCIVTEDSPGIMKSAQSKVSSLPMRISRWTFVAGFAGMCGFCGDCSSDKENGIRKSQRTYPTSFLSINNLTGACNPYMFLNVVSLRLSLVASHCITRDYQQLRWMRSRGTDVLESVFNRTCCLNFRSYTPGTILQSVV